MSPDFFVTYLPDRSSRWLCNETTLNVAAKADGLVHSVSLSALGPGQEDDLIAVSRPRLS